MANKCKLLGKADSNRRGETILYTQSASEIFHLLPLTQNLTFYRWVRESCLSEDSNVRVKIAVGKTGSDVVESLSSLYTLTSVKPRVHVCFFFSGFKRRGRKK